MRPRRRPPRAAATAGLAALLALAAGCTFDRHTVAPGEETPVVHAVLNPEACEQTVLLERTLTGRVTVVADSSTYDPADPIVSGGGVPIHDARVVIAREGAGGGQVVAVERRTRDGSRGTGVYRFLNAPSNACVDTAPSLAVRRGGRYALRVETPEGRVVTARTVLPEGSSGAQELELRNFDRDRDTLRASWPAAALARTYAMRIESPFGPFFLFTDSTSLSLSGELRNLFTENFPRVFIPGFRQRVTVAAVDTNFFDYYRSQNNPFTGSGIINRLEGGIGLFGAFVPVFKRDVGVVATRRDPVEGSYRGLSSDGPEALEFWIESEANGVERLTGRYYYRGETSAPFGLVGFRQNGVITLYALLNDDARRRWRRFSGTASAGLLTLDVGPATQPQQSERVLLRKLPD